MPVPVIETARLRLRPRVMSDLEANLAMDMDPEVQRHLPQLRGRTPDAHRAELRARYESDWPQTGGLWVVEPRDAPRFLGWCALFPLEVSGLIEIGYRYCRAAWGCGVASEAGAAVLEHGFLVQAFDPIVGVTDPENTASQRVLEKLGLRRKGLRRHYGLDLSFFELTRAEYETGRSADR